MYNPMKCIHIYVCYICIWNIIYVLNIILIFAMCVAQQKKVKQPLEKSNGYHILYPFFFLISVGIIFIHSGKKLLFASSIQLFVSIICSSLYLENHWHLIYFVVIKDRLFLFFTRLNKYCIALNSNSVSNTRK